MPNGETYYTVAQCANLCSVGRGTVHYWIKKGKLHAIRSGKSYTVPIQELLLFLKNTGRPVPSALNQDFSGSPLFAMHKPCWETGHGDPGGTPCRDCLVFQRGLDLCLSARGSSEIHCPTPCIQCRYYQDVLFPKIQFVHQIEAPAVVVKDLFLLAANGAFADICGLKPEDIPGLGIEHTTHPDSLPKVLANARKRNLNDREVPRNYHIFVRTKDNDRAPACVAVYPLNEPSGAYLVVGEETADGASEKTFL
jgi:excisionase family DNA binding protein